MTSDQIKRPRGRPSLNRPQSAKGARITHHALHAHALEKLRGMIVQGKLKAGERIAEAALCDLLGVSRTPLREALKLLRAEGLIELWPNRGATITPIRAEEMVPLFEAVAGIERCAAELAAERITPAELRRLRTMQERMEKHFAARQRTEYFRINQEIHAAIVSAAKNEILASTHTWLLSRAERARYFALDRHERWQESVEEHRAILAAIEDGRSQDAGLLLRDHVAHTGKAVAQRLTMPERRKEKIQT